jgi:hypothetical protein
MRFHHVLISIASYLLHSLLVQVLSCKLSVFFCYTQAIHHQLGPTILRCILQLRPLTPDKILLGWCAFVQNDLNAATRDYRLIVYIAPGNSA